MSTESKHSGSVWCEHCRDHFPEYHYDDEGSHRVGYEWGPTGSKSQHIRDLEEQFETWQSFATDAAAWIDRYARTGGNAGYTDLLLRWDVLASNPATGAGIASSSTQSEDGPEGNEGRPAPVPATEPDA